MDYLSEVNTVNDRDLILSEIESYKRKDLDSIRKSFLDILPSIDIDDLYKKLKKSEVAKIILAIEPTVGILKDIKSYFEENLKDKIIFDFEVDNEMLSGIKIVYRGKYFDFSVWIIMNRFQIMIFT